MTEATELNTGASGISPWIKLLKTWYPVLLAFLLHEALLMISVYGQNFSIFHAADFVRWDSALYLDIAAKGYELLPCRDLFSAYPSTSTDWCGNAGWMPLYPLLIRGLTNLGMAPYTAGFLIAKSCLLTVYACIWLLTLKQTKQTRVYTLLLMAAFPASVYYDAVFPVSLMLALVLGSFCLWQSKHYKTAGILAFMIPLSYSTGFVCVAVWLGYSALLYFRKTDKWRPAAYMAAAALAGYGTFFIIQMLSTGVWNGFFLIQMKYGHGMHNVFETLLEKAISLYKSGINHNWQNIQTVLFVLLMLYTAVFNLKKETEESLFIRLYVLAFALFPLLIGSALLSQFRAESLLLPLVVLLGKKHKLALLLIPVFVYLFLQCSAEFFHGSIT